MSRFRPIVFVLVPLLLVLAGTTVAGSAASDPGAASPAPSANPHAAADPHVSAESPARAGEYLVRIGGCNDCHTPGYEQAGGEMPVEQWLTGSPVGYRGPWGTTYASNLRLLATDVSMDEWVERYSTAELRPPMPWWALHEMSDADLRAVYAFIRSLGPKGDPVPDYVPPGQDPETPYIPMAPVGTGD